MTFPSKLNKYLLLAALLFIACGQQKTTPQNNNQTKPIGRVVAPERSLTFIDFDGSPLSTLEVQIADEPLERNEGLMDVRDMPETHGMVFIFEQEEPLSFWMANTPLPLDIMYVNSDSTIVRIYHNTTPFSETTLPSEAPAIFVVETNGGYCLSHGILEGMKVRF